MKKNYFLLSLILLGTNLLAQEYKMPVANVVSQQPSQTGNEPILAADGNVNTIYHSKWGQTGIPDQLDFSFSDRVKSIKSLVYNPRITGTNGNWTNVDIYYSTKDAPTNFIKINSASIVWDATATAKRIDLDKEIINPAVIRVKVNGGVGNFSSCAEMEFISNQPAKAITSECDFPTSEFAAYNDIKVSPIVANSSASNFQQGEEIDKSFDGNFNTLYHSNYNTSSTAFPISLVYNFDGNTPLDYLIYYPRQDGGINGNFGKVKISYNTATNANYVELSSQDFLQQNDARKVVFGSQIKPLNVKFEILDGRGSFASAAEMEFYTKNSNTLDTSSFKSLFKDDVYSGLNTGVTQQQITAITSPFYKALGQCMLDGKYKTTDRVKEHKSYTPIAIINKNYKVGNYNLFENPTGVVFAENKTSVIFVENIPANTNVYLRVRDSGNEANVTDKMYPITNGTNIVNVTNNGLGYISYYSDQINLPKIKINITSGIVNGVFNTYKTTSAEWKQILDNDVYSKVDVVGHYTQLMIDKIPTKVFHYETAQPLIDVYDQISKSERELMGFFKYQKDTDTKQLVYTESKGGWFAGGLGAHLDLTWGTANSTSATGLDVWGVAHELGHVNQIRPDIKWVGTTEVTNNVYSVWATYNLKKQAGKYNYLRVESETGDVTNFPKVSGNRYGEFIKHTLINKQSFNDVKVDPFFRKLVPFWQLSLYYQLAGASKGAETLAFDKDMSDELTNKTTPPLADVDYAHWFAYASEQARNRDSSKISSGQNSLNFAKDVADAVKEDLTEFFTNIGFFTPVNVNIDDYGVQNITITQAMIDDAKAYIKSKNYPKPVSPVIHYLNSFNVNIYKDKLALNGSTGIGAAVETNANGTFLVVDNSKWTNAVAYETYNTKDELISVSVLGTGDVSLAKTYVDYPTDAAKVYAVGFDGKKILVYPVNLSVDNLATKAGFSITPNPIKNQSDIKITIPNAKGVYTINVYDVSGKVLVNANGNLTELNSIVNSKLKSASSGIYVITINNDTEKYSQKVIKQ